MLQKNKAKFNFKIDTIVLLFVFAILIYFPVFLQLDFLSIQAWDESLFAIRAYFFAKNGEAIQNFNQLDGLNQLSNSKPVFMTMIQAGFMKVFGFNELSLRLPNAIIFTIFNFSLLLISEKIFNTIYIGFLSILILLTSPGIFANHMLRFGDQDIAFAIFSFMFVYYFYLFLNTNKTKHLLLGLVFFLFGFYTKSISIFLVFPGLFIYSLLNKKVLILLKNKKFIASFIFVIIIVLVSTFGNINHVANYKRLTQVIQHSGPFLYYYYDFFKIGNLMPWLLLLPIFIWFYPKNKFIQLLIWQSITIFFVLSFAQTKLYWYASPIYFFLAPVFAYVIFHLISYTAIGLNLSESKRKFFVVIMCIAIFGIPYYKTIETINFPNDPNKDNHIGFVLNRAKKNYPQIKNIQLVTIPSRKYKPQIEYYVMLLNTEFNYKITRQKSSQNIKSNEIILSNNHNELILLDEKFKLDTLLFFQETFLIKTSNEL